MLPFINCYEAAYTNVRKQQKIKSNTFIIRYNEWRHATKEQGSERHEQDFCRYKQTMCYIWEIKGINNKMQWNLDLSFQLNSFFLNVNILRLNHVKQLFPTFIASQFSLLKTLSVIKKIICRNSKYTNIMKWDSFTWLYEMSLLLYLLLLLFIYRIKCLGGLS